MDERFIVLVAKYIDNELNEKEKIEFENFLSDPHCRAYLQDAENLEDLLKEESRRLFIEQAADSGVEIDDDAELMDEILHDIREYGGKRNPEYVQMADDARRSMLKGRKRIRLIIYSATLAAAIIAGLLVLYKFPSEPVNEKIFREYYKPYYPVVTRGVKETRKEHHETEKLNAQENNIDSTDAIIQVVKVDPEAGLLYGIELMSEYSMQAAVNQFHSLKDPSIKKNLIQDSKISWYSALAYIYMGELDSALLELEEMKTGHEFFREDAEELIGVIEGIRE